MRTIPTGRLLRMLRIRKGWRQADVAVSARISPSTVGRHERGWIGSVVALESHAGVFGLRVELRLVGRAGELVRLADEEHAALAEALATWFRQQGCLAEAEVSFSEWGERGRIDLLVCHPPTATLVVVEVKTQLLDLQDLFGALDVKARLAATIAQRRGWRARQTSVLLAVAATAANRSMARQHPALFGSFSRGRLSISALARPSARLLYWAPPSRTTRSSWVAGRQRVRPPRSSPTVS